MRSDGNTGLLTRRCSRCGDDKPVGQFSRCAKQGWQRYCRRCHRLRMRKYRLRINESARLVERYQSDTEYRKRVRARNRVRMQVARGTRPRLVCERCGVILSEMHHEDYELPNEVRHLCGLCHGTEHYPQATETAERKLDTESRFRALLRKYSNR